MPDYTAVRYRLDEWAAHNRGGLPGSFGSLWPEKFYVGGELTGSETATCVASRGTINNRMAEWPPNVVHVDCAIREMVAHHDKDYGQQLFLAIWWEHTIDETVQVRAIKAGMGKSLFERRRLAAYAWIDHYLHGPTIKDLMRTQKVG